MASIRTADLIKDFGDLRAVNEIDLDLPEGGSFQPLPAFWRHCNAASQQYLGAAPPGGSDPYEQTRRSSCWLPSSNGTSSAASISFRSSVGCIDQPTTRRAHKFSTTAKYNLSSSNSATSAGLLICFRARCSPRATRVPSSIAALNWAARPVLMPATSCCNSTVLSAWRPRSPPAAISI